MQGTLATEQPGEPPPPGEREKRGSPLLPALAKRERSAQLPAAENTKLPDWMIKLFLCQCIIELSNFATKNILAALFESATVEFLLERLGTMLERAQISRVKRQSSQKSVRCYRCGSEKHIRKNCNEKVWCSRCNKDTHSTEACRNKTSSRAAAAPPLCRTLPESRTGRPFGGSCSNHGFRSNGQEGKSRRGCPGRRSRKPSTPPSLPQL